MNRLHDPLDIRGVLSDELEQLTESGYETAGAVAEFSRLDPGDVPGHEALLNRMTHLPRSSGWKYDEPDALDEIVLTWTVDDDPAFRPVEDRIHGSWLGRIAGCNLGKPLEQGDHWTPEHIRNYLELTGAYPLRDYVPVADPMPSGFELKDNWPQTTRGNVSGSARDDDIDYAILGVHLLEQYGSNLTTAHVAEAWLAYLPYARIFTAERATYVNLLHGIPAERAAEHRNPWREWIGALIRGDAFGWTHAGRPYAAARAAYADARLSHRANGIYGEMWSAALVSSALVTRDPAEAVERSLGVVPPRSRLAESIVFVRGLHAEGHDWDSALVSIRQKYDHYSWVHTVNNAAAITAGLLWSEGDFATAIGNTVLAGWDTDSNGATVGSVMGALLGAAALPANFIDPLEDFTRSAVFGYDHSSISGLGRRTVAVANGLLPEAAQKRPRAAGNGESGFETLAG
jgi:ADP-ribosylglycohydrolase